MRKLIAAMLLAGTATTIAAATAPAQEAPAAARTWGADKAAGGRELDAMWPRVAQPDDQVGIRGVFRFALESAGLNWRPERIAPALDLARRMQDLDPASKTYGNFRWRYGQSAVFDVNGVEFSMFQAGLMHRLFGDRLPPDARTKLEALIDTGIKGMQRHPVKLDYTNIYLTQAANLILCGEAANRPEIAAQGYARLDAWLAFTTGHGVTEFDSPTYYGIDIEALAAIARYAARTEGRAQAAVALRYFWADVAANWWAPGDRLGGANARSYDYLWGRGYLEAQTWPAGWLRALPELEGAGWIAGPRANLVSMLDAAEWGPDQEQADALRRQVPRTVVQKWGAEPERIATQYVGRSFSLGSAGAGRGGDDRMLVGNIGNSPDFAQMILFMDGRGDPFGRNKQAERQGAMKALHLVPFLATVPRGPEILQLLAAGPGIEMKNGDKLDRLLTQFTIPAQAEIWVGDKRVQPGTPQTPTRIPAGALVSVRWKDAVIGLRILLATAATSEGGGAAIELVREKVGDPASRLTIVHAAHEPTGQGLAALWLRGAEGIDARSFARWRKAFAAAEAHVEQHGGVVRLNVAGTRGPMRIEADPTHGNRIRTEGAEPAPKLLSVNGREVGYPILTRAARRIVQ
ncbi:MAG: hypothetical protein IIZ38_11485 [Sphingomonas sp.]|uniref:hypothetical protein n=1 Tax=Sphingomonas sp. TaxID=28214 RepID=UPI0025E9837C|nr:hypothetical protein [Sphingomonas sp.]MBQ1498925.1 hypothetical protein [Sphingomonas sp.]MBQ8103162.1 hypothetical protein [Afipia sp.]